MSRGPLAAPGRPWGLATTTGFSLVVAAVFIGSGTLIERLLLAVVRPRDPGLYVDHHYGTLVAVSAIAVAPLCLALIALFAGLRRGIGLPAYLALHAPRPSQVLIWTAIQVAFLAALQAVLVLAGRSLVTDFELHVYSTADAQWLLWSALVVAVPVLEEAFFRGFMFAGVAASRFGGAGAVVITAVVWAGLHWQYDLLEMAIIFAGGLLLGAARLRTGSLYITVYLHALWNLLSLTETHLYINCMFETHGYCRLLFGS